jgi:hypothetical protein
MFKYLLLYFSAPFYPKYTFDKLKQKELSELTSLKYIFINMFLGLLVASVIVYKTNISYRPDLYSYYIKYHISIYMFTLISLYLTAYFTKICILLFKHNKYSSPQIMLILSFSILVYTPLYFIGKDEEYFGVFYSVLSIWPIFIIRSGFKRLLVLDSFTSLILIISVMFVSYHLTSWISQLLAFVYS